MHKLISTSAVAFALLAPAAAHAASGTVRGYWKNYQNQGNYCDEATRNCSSARYLKSEYQTYHPISDTKVYIKDPSGVVIGTGVTNVNGYFNIAWNRSSTPSYVRVYWQFEHKDDRFKVRGETGGILAKWSGQIDVTSGGISHVGTLYAGTSGSISGLANIYDGADRMWNDSLRYSARMVNIFTGLTIRAYPTKCKSGCANSGTNLIQLPPEAPFKPQARILHEMGHIAAGKSAGASMNPGSYCYPLAEQPPSDAETCSDGTSKTWGSTTNEWRGVALEEAIATVLGDIAIYWSGAVDPRTCNSTGECTSSGSIENSIACSGTVGRRMLQMDRYLWDTYDLQSDGDDNVSEGYYVFVDTLAAIPSGTSWGKLSSYSDGSGGVNCWDCFHPWEWHNALLNYWGGASETEDIYFQNCMNWF